MYLKDKSSRNPNVPLIGHMLRQKESICLRLAKTSTSGEVNFKCEPRNFYVLMCFCLCVFYVFIAIARLNTVPGPYGTARVALPKERNGCLIADYSVVII